MKSRLSYGSDIHFLSVGFTACGDDDDDEGGNFTSNELIGSWETYWEAGYEKTDGKEDDRWDGAVPEDKKDIITFNADGTARSDGRLATWKLNGKKLTITDTDETYSETATILKLTSSELIVETYEKDGRYEYYEKYTYKKVK